MVSCPSAPQGPLQYPGTTHDTVTLAWRAPEDDGGNDITGISLLIKIFFFYLIQLFLHNFYYYIGYIIEMSEFGTDSWKTVPGFCPNTSFTVKGLNEGKRYVFRVKAENMYGVSEPLEGAPVTAKSPFDPPDAPGQPEVTNYSPNSCSLSWTPPLNTGGRPITGIILTITYIYVKY